mmetsp:Transcript_28873/g.62864  ORF Transcript_28873/g.62864 Transcript_28873/m.62864 type:complete len:143 (-) Transcript_28873:131-559(-)
MRSLRPSAASAIALWAALALTGTDARQVGTVPAAAAAAAPAARPAAAAPGPDLSLLEMAIQEDIDNDDIGMVDGSVFGLQRGYVIDRRSAAAGRQALDSASPVGNGDATVKKERVKKSGIGAGSVFGLQRSFSVEKRLPPKP